MYITPGAVTVLNGKARSWILQSLQSFSNRFPTYALGRNRITPVTFAAEVNVAVHHGLRPSWS